MIKNAVIYRIAPGFQPSLEAMEQALQAHGFIVTSPHQEKSVGWVPPRGDEFGALVECAGIGWRVLRFMIETRSVPGLAVRQHAQAAADKIEAETGRVPGKKETRTLREDALLALLPDAFPRQQAIWVLVNLDSGWIVVDSASQGRIDEVVTGLVSTFTDLSMQLLQTTLTPLTAMTNWLCAESNDDLPLDFSIGRECELKSGDEEKAVVRFTRHNLQSEQVRQHVTEGKLPTRLALSWADRIGFVMDQGMRMRKIAFLEGVFEDRQADDATGFDTDAVLTTGELGKLIPALVDALGGVVGIEPA